ncbi:hypothetical protein R50072_11390 [Simiduia litorea]|uniref:hypothetical protein n=1 Tax=Simiduia litorea TaxID=1435348 RepID=UPI0036F38E87
MKNQDRKDSTKTRCLVSWLGASCVGFIAASLFHSQQVQANLINVGANVDIATRFAAATDDLLGLSASYLPIIAIGFAIAFSVATFIKRKTALAPTLLYGLAGATALGCILGLMQPIMEITLIAGARHWVGFCLQIIAGALGGFTYALLVQPRPTA